MKKAVVVREMGILSTTSNYQNCIKSTNNKIPEYATNYKKEYIFNLFFSKIKIEGCDSDSDCDSDCDCDSDSDIEIEFVLPDSDSE